MISTTPRKTGRPIAAHRDRHGNQIEGLKRLKDGRWRAYGPERFTFTEPDENLAIARFRQWQQRKATRELGTVAVFKDYEEAGKAFGKRLLVSRDATTPASPARVTTVAGWRRGCLPK